MIQDVPSLFFNLDVMVEYFPRILAGFWVTLKIALLVIVLGIPSGLLLAALRSYQLRPVNWIIVFFADAFRAVPALVILVLVYFGLPYAGIRLSSEVSLVLTLSAVLAAFAEEIFWAGITSIDRRQWEASRSTGMSFAQTLIIVVLPQAVKLTIPLITNRTIAITKGTSLGSVVAVQEILSQAQSAQSISANPSPLTLGALLYLIIFAPLVAFTRRLERQFDRND